MREKGRKKAKQSEEKRLQVIPGTKNTVLCVCVCVCACVCVRARTRLRALGVNGNGTVEPGEAGGENER